MVEYVLYRRDVSRSDGVHILAKLDDEVVGIDGLYYGCLICGTIVC